MTRMASLWLRIGFARRSYTKGWFVSYVGIDVDIGEEVRLSTQRFSMFTSGASGGVLEGSRLVGLTVGGPAADIISELGSFDWLADVRRSK